MLSAHYNHVSGLRRAIPSTRQVDRVACRSSRGKCHYDVLGVNPTSSDEEIKSAFRQQAKQWHPDVNNEVRVRVIMHGMRLHGMFHGRRAPRSDPYENCQFVHAWNAQPWPCDLCYDNAIHMITTSSPSTGRCGGQFHPNKQCLPDTL